jgi:hypothetical protein
MFLWPWQPAVPGLSICTSVVFLAVPVTCGGGDARAGPGGGKEGGLRGETSGEPWRLWGRVPPWFPPARGESAAGRPL